MSSVTFVKGLWRRWQNKELPTRTGPELWCKHRVWKINKHAPRHWIFWGWTYYPLFPESHQALEEVLSLWFSYESLGLLPPEALGYDSAWSTLKGLGFRESVVRWGLWWFRVGMRLNWHLWCSLRQNPHLPLLPGRRQPYAGKASADESCLSFSLLWEQP